MITNRLEPDLLVNAGALLGELPRWCATRERLLWMDVDRGLLHETDPETGQDREHDVALGVGALAPCHDGRVALGTRERFAIADLQDGRQRVVAPLPSNRDEILNDGACDPVGRLWAGSYAEGERPHGGRLYCLDLDGEVRVALEGVTLSNGLGWSPDHRLMYYIDTLTHGIDVFDYDLGTGTIRERRRLVTVPKAVGLPDGLAVDVDGGIWVAIWGGAQVQRYAPDGRLDRVVQLPTDHITACAFGGSDGATLFITSAAGSLDDDARRRQPHAGALFAVDPGVSGPPAHQLATSISG